MRELDPPLNLGDIAAHLGISIASDDLDRPVRRIAPLSQAGSTDLSFLADDRYASQLTQSGAGAVLIDASRAANVPPGMIPLIVADPYQAFAKVTALFARKIYPQAQPTKAIAESTVIDSTAKIDAGVQIAPHCSIGAHSQIGANVCIGAGSVIEDGVTVGDGTVIGPRVTVYRNCRIGARCVIQAGTVIGADGFGYAKDGDRWQKIWQLGDVVIGNRVEIGANCCIDRGALEDTVIGDDCILDNLIQVAHNVRIGDGTALAGCVGIAGSAQIGKHCLIGGGAGILGHLSLSDRVVISPMSLVTRSINKPGFYSGSFPLMENAQWEKAAASLRRLPDLRSRLRQLEKLTRETE